MSPLLVNACIADYLMPNVELGSYAHFQESLNTPYCAHIAHLNEDW